MQSGMMMKMFEKYPFYMLPWILSLLLLFCNFQEIKCWDTSDLELFDLVEEVNKNFYELFGVEQSASTSEIRRAYRKLSLQYHPDKNDAADAEDKFRQIVAVYEVLKDEAKREKYNTVLVEGLPDWKQPMFYYRRARKMGFVELAIVLSFIVTVGQYFVGWAVYLEKRLVAEEFLSTRKKKKNKKAKNAANDDETEEEVLNSIPTPHVSQLWPFQLSKFIFLSVVNLPSSVKQWKAEKILRQEREAELRAAEKREAEEAERAKEEWARKPKKKVQTELPEYSAEMYAKFMNGKEKTKSGVVQSDEPIKTQNKSQGDWTDEELILLSRAVNRFPGGTHQRWEKIAEMVGRSIKEVITKSKQTKGLNYSMNLNTSVQGSNFKSKPAIDDTIITRENKNSTIQECSTESQTKKRKPLNNTSVVSEKTLVVAQTIEKEKKIVPKDSVNTPNLEVKSESDKWTQNQQTILEWALKNYPKDTENRWDVIAEHIPGKSKEECVARFRMLAEIIRKKKKQ